MANPSIEMPAPERTYAITYARKYVHTHARTDVQAVNIMLLALPAGWTKALDSF